MGSIPPAASIEHPQREIVNLIADAAAVTPSASDLHQLGKSLQSGKINYGVDIGVVNAAIVPLSPIPDTYYGGMVVRFKAKFAPTAATTLDAGRGARAIVKSGGALLQGAEWSIGDVITVTYDNVTNHWTLPPSPIAMLYAPKDYYVSNTGSDGNDGLTVGSPFLTLQKAQDTCALFNQNGYGITIHVADGTYNGVSCGEINGTGTITYIGNHANPQACNVNNVNAPAFAIFGGQIYTIDGFSVGATGSAPGAVPAGLWGASAAFVVVYAVNFRQCNAGHILAESGSVFLYGGPVTISGGGPAHMTILNGSSIRSPLVPPTLAVLAAVSITYFVSAAGNSQVYVTYTSITSPGLITGTKYICTTNAVVVNGGGINYYPGTVAGSTYSGGQYA